MRALLRIGRKSVKDIEVGCPLFRTPNILYNYLTYETLYFLRFEDGLICYSIFGLHNGQPHKGIGSCSTRLLRFTVDGPSLYELGYS